MTYEINGNKGAYDGIIQDNSSRYGRNAVSNHQSFIIKPMLETMENPAPMLNFMPDEKSQQENIKAIEHFIEKNDADVRNLPPIEYEYRYMPPSTPKGTVDKKALLGASLEELGDEAVTVDDFEANYLPNKEIMTAKPIDINNDGYIDVGEYSSTILAADMMSKPNPDISEINGSINAQGLNAVMAYANKSNAEAATKLYSDLYNRFDLGKID